MFPIKRLYTFIYQTFLPLFIMTFGICHFIFIIQFLWQHIDKLVGKGLETSVIIELFSYGALMLIPQALPLAILLASLMTFGNLGERLELLAIKASGVSLMQLMKPMIVLIGIISLGSFYFQNNLAPNLNVKVYSLLYSIRQKSPALDIPEGAFYSDMKGYSIYVKKKDLETGMLHNVIIYDLSKGTGVSNIAVDVCDSAQMVMGDDRDYLTLTLYDGESFQNIKQQGGIAKKESKENIPYVRERYKKKEVVMPFKADLERVDESRWDDSQLSKGLGALQVSIDSMSKKVDSLNVVDLNIIKSQSVVKYQETEQYKTEKEKIVEEDLPDVYAEVLNFDSVFNSYSLSTTKDLLSTASAEARNAVSNRNANFHVDMPKSVVQRSIRMHKIYWHRMFTLPFACIIFFFIGAPLGAIIKKGGLGLPVVISVVLFIIYYIIDNIGYKMARDGIWPVWQGVWLSASVLFPLGVFLTYKSTKESDLFNFELYGRFIRKVFRIKSNGDWNPTREIKVEEISNLETLGVTQDEIDNLKDMDNRTLKDIIHNYSQYGFSRDAKLISLSLLKQRGTYFFDVRVNNYDYNYSKYLCSLFDKNSKVMAIPLYCMIIVLFIASSFFNTPVINTLLIIAGIGYFISYIRAVFYETDFNRTMSKEIRDLASANDRMRYAFLLGVNYWFFMIMYYIVKYFRYILLFFLYPLQYLLLKRVMEQDLERIHELKY